MKYMSILREQEAMHNKFVMRSEINMPQKITPQIIKTKRLNIMSS